MTRCRKPDTKLQREDEEVTQKCRVNRSMAVLIVEVCLFLALGDAQRVAAGDGEYGRRRVRDGAPGR